MPLATTIQQTILACGMNAEELGSLMKMLFDMGFRYTRCDDVSCFDASVTSAMCAYEHRVYNRAGVYSEADLRDASVFYKTREFKSKKYGISFRATGKRASGDFCTSIGNSVINECAVRTAHRLSDPNREYVSLIYSDDSTHFYRVAPTTKFNSDYVRAMEEIGFHIKTPKMQNGMEYGDKPSQATFLASHPMPALRDGEEVWIMVPTIGRCLSKICYSVSPISRVNPRLFFANIAQMMLDTYGFVNLYKEVFTSWLRKLDVRPRGPAVLESWSLQMLQSVYNVTPAPENLQEQFFVDRYGAADFETVKQQFHYYTVSGMLVYPLDIPYRVVDVDYQ